MNRTALVGVAACALLTLGTGTAAAQGVPLTASDVDVSTGSASDLGNLVGAGSVDLTGLSVILGGAFGLGYLNGVLSTLSAH